ncbi:MAG: MBOAT family protein, partial [Myxococcota bacterium]
MLFNSLEFIIFFAVVGVGYAATSRSLFWQNTWLLAGSIVFYGFWDWRFLFLVASNVVVVHLAASRIVRPSSRRKAWLALAVVFNLGVLAFFKYANFFVDSATEFLALIGLTPDRVTIKIILPVGISFYTFQALSYVVDVYRGDVRPARSVR